VPGKAFPSGGNAINIGGFGAVAAVTYIGVLNNLTCHAGHIIVAPGPGNVVRGNRDCAGS
jgi:hypothetical protein